MKDILKNLNPEQKKAATSNAKYLQISAGPGTGKTSTLAARIFYLLEERDLQPDELIAISFSRAAKQELIEKLRYYTELTGTGSIIEILTFHSLAHRIIRYGIFTGESKFSAGFKTINTEGFILMNPEILHGLCTDYSNRDLAGNGLVKALNLLRQGKYIDDQIYKHWSDLEANKEYHVNLDASYRLIIKSEDLIEFWRRVEKLETRYNVTDFQGLITEGIKLLQRRSEAYGMLANHLRHILIDEYQDTSISQESLLFQLASQNTEITVVGDENQTIYTFNGSNPDNLTRFYNHCIHLSSGKTERIKLKKNYRSVKEIIQLSNHFLGKKIIQPSENTKSGDVKPVVVKTPSIDLAATYIATRIEKLHGEDKIPFKDICVLYRKNSEYAPQADEVKKAFEQSRIPYQESQHNQKNNDYLIDKIFEICDEYPGLDLEELIHSAGEDIKPEIRDFITDAINQGANDTDDLIDYVIDLNKQENKEENQVCLSTVHNAKGKEFPVVFILYLGDTEFPHGSLPDIDEEKRLLYVAITRAMSQLYILGQNGIRYEDFLGKCSSSPNVQYVEYNSRYAERTGKSFEKQEELLIKETTRKLEEQEKSRQEYYKDLMKDFW